MRVTDFGRVATVASRCVSVRLSWSLTIRADEARLLECFAMAKEPPTVYGSVRAVGTLRPRFNPTLGQGFSNELNVVGTAFWLKEYQLLMTCAHVVLPLFGPAIETTGLLVVGNAGNYRRATISCLDLVHDLAVLAVLGTNNEPITGAELATEAAGGLRVSSEYPRVLYASRICWFSARPTAARCGALSDLL